MLEELNKTRICPHTILSENGQFLLDICPEIGLSTQNYLCAECNDSFESGKFCIIRKVGISHVE